MNKCNMHVYITWTPVLRIWLWGFSVLNVAYVILTVGFYSKQPEVVLIQEIVSCSFPGKHIGFFGCCGLVWPACCCSSLVLQSCSSLPGYLCAWEWGQAKCLKGGLPSTSSLAKTKKCKSCIQAWQPALQTPVCPLCLAQRHSCEPKRLVCLPGKVLHAISCITTTATHPGNSWLWECCQI